MKEIGILLLADSGSGELVPSLDTAAILSGCKVSRRIVSSPEEVLEALEKSGGVFNVVILDESLYSSWSNESCVAPGIAEARMAFPGDFLEMVWARGYPGLLVWSFTTTFERPFNMYPLRYTGGTELRPMANREGTKIMESGVFVNKVSYDAFQRVLELLG